MAQIILIEPDETLRELLTLNLTTYAGAEVIPKDSFAEALTLLQIIPNIDLIISRKIDKDGENSQSILDFISADERETSVILIGPEKLDPLALGMVIQIENPMEWEKVIKSSAKILGITQEVLEKKVRPDYVPIRIKVFKHLSSTPCDVFIRIKRGPGDYQFVKRLHAGDSYSDQLVTKYIEQGLLNFFVPNEYLTNFTNFVSDHFVEKLENLDFKNADSFEFLGESFDQILQNARELGFTTATIQLAEAVINSMLGSVQESEDVGPLLQKVLNSPTGLIYQHGHMSAIVSIEILKASGLGSKHNLEKVSYSALFKDVMFSDREEWLLIDSFEELENRHLPEADWDRVFAHALDGAALVQNTSDIPIGVADLIRHHHGVSNGKGFSLGQIDSLPDVSIVFILAVDFVNQLYSYQRSNNPEAKPVIANLKERFAHSKKAGKFLQELNKRLKKR